MSRVNGRAASGFRPKLHSRTEKSSLESLEKMSGLSGTTCAKGRAPSGFRPKLQIRAKSLKLESLDIRSGKSGHESRQGPSRLRIQTQIAESRREFDSGKAGHKVCKL